MSFQEHKRVHDATTNLLYAWFVTYLVWVIPKMPLKLNTFMMFDMLYYIYTNQDLRTLCSDSELSKSTLLLKMFLLLYQLTLGSRRTLLFWGGSHVSWGGTWWPWVLTSHFPMSLEYILRWTRNEQWWPTDRLIPSLSQSIARGKKSPCIIIFLVVQEQKTEKNKKRWQKPAWHANFMYSWQLTLRFQQPALHDIKFFCASYKRCKICK